MTTDSQRLSFTSDSKQHLVPICLVGAMFPSGEYCVFRF